MPADPDPESGAETAAQVPTKLGALRRLGELIVVSAGERVRGVGATSAADVPRGPEEIGAQWLTSVLCRRTPGARVIAVTTGAASSGTTTRRALAVDYNDAGMAAGLPRHLFVKCTSALPQRLMLGLGGLIEGEPGFYNHVRPVLRIEAPAGYFGAVDERSWRSIVVIEDVVSTRGARFWTADTEVSREQMEGLLENMARWHGALWDSARLSGWGWLKSTAEQMRLIDSLIGLANRIPAGSRRASAVMPSSLRSRQGDLFHGMRRSMQLAAAGTPTYLHGDLHVANTYVTADGRVGVGDWQVGLRGSWAQDYAYLMATALAVEDRRAWEEELLDFYLERLASFGGGRLARDSAWLSYRQSTLYPYFAWVYTLGRSRLQPAFQPAEVSLLMVERIAAAIEDLGSLGAVGL